MNWKQEKMMRWVITAIRIWLLVINGNFFWHLINQIIGFFSLSPVIWGLVHLYRWANKHLLESNHRKAFSMPVPRNSITFVKLSLSQTVRPKIWITRGKRFSSQVEQLEMMESDPAELPGGPPSLLQKALAGWAFSEQQGETLALSQRGWTL